MVKSAAVVIAIAAIVCANCSYSQTAAIPEAAELQTKYEEKVRLDVLRPHELTVADLNAKYAAALERAQESAQKAGNLDAAIAIKEEKEAVLSGKPMVQLDEAKAPASLKSMRVTYQAALAKLEMDRDKNLLPLKDAYARSLEALTVNLTKSGRLEEAMTLKKMREDLLASKGGGALAASVDPAGKSFTNSLGMKFVKVPGTNLLLCVHETRYKDYVKYAAEAPGISASWKDQSADGFGGVGNKDDYPVTKVSYEDAQAFCAWLSKKEGKTYRLPKDKEWSHAVGINRDEKWAASTTPENVFKSQAGYPWGDEWPPPKESGNYSDQSRQTQAPNAKTHYIAGYDDGFPTLAPVMSFKPNKLGLHDLSGNVFEWVEEWFNAEQKQRVLRGGSWYDGESIFLLSSFRYRSSSGSRGANQGFRCAIEIAP